MRRTRPVSGKAGIGHCMHWRNLDPASGTQGTAKALDCTADREFCGQRETGADVQHVLKWCMKAKAASIECWLTQHCTAVFTQVK